MAKRLIFLLLLALGIRAAPWPTDVANYQIDATLDAKQKALDGSEILTWRNDSDDAITELQFHLYMNAFRNNESTLMRESGGSLRRIHARKNAWGFITVNKLQLLGGSDLTRAIEFIHPDDDNTEDRTVFRIALPTPIPPHRTVQLRIEFHTQFPHVFARSGYHGDFLLVGQWYPKIGVYEHAGERYATRGQWNCHQYHATSEFYADFGSYDVNLTVPSNEVIGGTGVMVAKQKVGRMTRYSFHQDRVHDFAWTVEPSFIKVERVFRANEEVRPAELRETAARLGITPDEAKLTDVRMILLIQPEHASQVERHFRAIRSAIKYFGLWYGPYPYRTITVVDPPYGAEGAAGMEYPTFITAGTNWLVSKEETHPEDVIVHEFGHQYWQGTVATNEFEEPWMDEGFTTYSSGKLMDKVYGPGTPPLRVLHLPLAWFTEMPRLTQAQLDRSAYLLAAKTDAISRYAWQYQSDLSYGVNSYMRTGLTMRTLENYLGEATMARVMRAYYDRWQFAHPAAPDFFHVVSEVSGQDLTWFFQQTFLGSDVLDYQVAEISSKSAEKPEGIFDATRNTGTNKQSTDRDKPRKQFESKVTVRREGEVVMPVDVRVVFDDGHVERRQWDGRYRWVQYTFNGPWKIVSADIDPSHKYLLDINQANNGRLAKSAPGTVLKWASTLLFWMQEALQFAGGLL